MWIKESDEKKEEKRVTIAITNSKDMKMVLRTILWDRLKLLSLSSY
jgi:hypothetical protein